VLRRARALTRRRVFVHEAHAPACNVPPSTSGIWKRIL
jgi:hypothetical protein